MKLEQPIWPRLLPSSMVLAFATLGPLGRRRRAPGTWGSAAGLLYFTVFFWPLGFWPWSGFWTLVFSLPGLYLAVAMCGEAEFRLGRRDPGEVILDEFMAMPLCFLGWPALARAWPPWAVFLAGFLLFRLFDIAKPLGIRRLQDLPAGWGIVIDDVAAALAACAVLHAAAWAWSLW
ncbi:MAG: phosphatidylglycerophosphatase A [Opitutaceae bacterium]